MADGSAGPSKVKPLNLHPCAPKPQKAKGDIVKVKQCEFPPLPEPIPASPCALQKRAEKIKRGVVFCPKPPVEMPVEQPCLAICIEKVKNMPIPVRLNDPPRKCPVLRVETGFARCDRIRDKSAAHEDLPWPGCPAEPPPPPPVVVTPCEIQKKREKYLECKKKYEKYKP